MKAPTQISEVTTVIAETIERLESGQLDRKIGQEINNACGKMIATQKIQMEYKKLKTEIPDLNIDFMEKSLKK
jgi:hypothetical protein